MVVSIRTRSQCTQAAKTPCLSSAPGRRHTVLGCVLLVFLFCLTTTASAERSQSYTFGVFPYLSSGHLETIYAPMGAALSQVLGCSMRFRTSSTFATFAENLRKQVYDIAFIQPFFYAMIAREAGYLPMARVDTELSGLIMVPHDSALQGLSDLRGATLALPPVEAAVSHLAKIMLLHNGLDPERDVTLKHVPSHSACLHQLLVGTAQACATANSPLRIFQQQHHVRFRQLARTPSIPSSLFVAHARMGSHDRVQLQRALVTWHQSEPGQTLLARARFSRLVPASDATYTVVQTYWKEIMETCSRDCP